MRTSGNIIIMIIAATLLFTGSTSAATADVDEQKIIHQRLAATIKEVALNKESGQPLEVIRDTMMAVMSEAIKNNTAERKRASVVKTCMECRAGKQVKVIISGQTSVLDAETQAIINRKMAAMVEQTIRERSSDPVVVRAVQRRMMDERMRNNFLRNKVQPLMIQQILLAGTINTAEKNKAQPTLSLKKAHKQATISYRKNRLTTSNSIIKAYSL